MKEPAYEASKLKFQKIEGKKYEEGFSDDEEDDRFFDMDFRTEGRKEEFSEMKSGLLSPLK